MAKVNKISSFKSFTEIRKQESVSKLREENNSKRHDSVTKISAILDELGLTSFEGLEEDQKEAIISKIFGDVSEEEIAEIEVEVEEVTESIKCSNKKGHSYKEIDKDGTVECEHCGLRNSLSEEVEEVTESIKVEGKRDAKKVVTQYNKIFNKILVDFGAMSNESILGCIKYLMFEAMGDANFHREALPTSKIIKGSIKPLEIKMPGLGGHFVKIGPSTIKTILSKYYSDIANAAGWSGQGIVEGTALYLEQIKQEAMGQAIINKFNATFEGEDLRIDLDSKLNELKEVELITIDDESKILNEGTRGQFGKIDKKGNITSVYTHYDSYPESMLPIIKSTFKAGKNVDFVIKNGSNSGLDADVKKINFYGGDSNPMKGNIKNINKYIKDANGDGGAEFVYLWDEGSKKWMMADIYKETGLVPAFESVINDESQK